MPVAATKHTAAGAQAFAKFFIQTIDWGYATTSSTYMKRYYQPTCRECRYTRLLLDNASRMGNHYVGGRLTLGSVAMPIAGGPERAEYTVRTVLTIAAIEVVDRRGTASHPEAPHLGFMEFVSVRWLRASWSVVRIHGQDR